MAPDHAVVVARHGASLLAADGKEGIAVSIFPTKILLATDGSRDAELALRTAVDLANSTNSELHVVTVAPGYPSYDVRNPSVVEYLRQRAENILEDQTRKIEQAGGEVAQKHLRVSERYRAEQIVRVAQDIEADLIVMGSRGLGGIRRALMGSVSDSVVHHAHCPVLVVRSEQEQAA
jgi:nucleotide-binding universal stress UspA family protein